MGKIYDDEAYDDYYEEDLSQEMKRVSKDVMNVSRKAIKRGATKIKASSGGLFVAKILKILGYVGIVIGVLGFIIILFSKPDVSYFGSIGLDRGISGLFFLWAFMYLMASLGGSLILLYFGYMMEYMYITNLKLEKISKLTIDTNEILFYQNELLEKNQVKNG